jgi:isopropanol dehydrogenase (NADP+)
MRGYILTGNGHGAWTDVAERVVGAEDALVRPTAVAPCTTDVHLIQSPMTFPYAVGKVIGHEAVGVVEEIGSTVRDFAVGDRVVIPCGFSDWNHPKAQRGEAKYHQPNNPYFSPNPDNAGVFSERVKVFAADQNLAHIPNGVSDLQAVMVPDMMATGFTGVGPMHIEFGDTVVILGIGPVGLMGVAASALRGAGRIIAVGSRPGTIELARQYGATDIVDYTQGPVAESVLDLVGGESVDSVLIASGGRATDVFTVALKVVKYGGHISNVSGFFSEETLELPLKLLNYGVMEKAITGVLVQDGREYLERLLLLIANGRIDTAPIVSHVLQGWDEVETAIGLLRDRDPNVVKPVVLV